MPKFELEISEGEVKAAAKFLKSRHLIRHIKPEYFAVICKYQRLKFSELYDLVGEFSQAFDENVPRDLKIKEIPE